jgi:hypothetical protein
VLTAYLDESGQESKGRVFIAGFLGNDDQWKKCAANWKTALGGRKSLHMRKLRWSSHRTGPLLARLGPVPRNAGLEPLLGGVKVTDYEDLVAGSIGEKLLAGYIAALYPLVIKALQYVPRDERLELVLGQQQRYALFANLMLGALAKMRFPAEMFLTDKGLPKLASWRSVPRESTHLCEPADYLAYATTQVYRDRGSLRAKMCLPIMGDDATFTGEVLSREKVRGAIGLVMAMIKSGRDLAMDLKPKSEEEFEQLASLLQDATRRNNA